MKSNRIKRMEVIVTLLCVGVFSSVVSAQEPCWNITYLTDNTALGDVRPTIFGDNVVWTDRDDGDRELFLYNGSETIKLTDNDVNDGYYRIHGNKMVWSGYDGNDFEIFLHNGVEAIQLTDNEVDDRSVRLWDDTVAWTSDEGSSSEIFLYNGIETIQLTENEINEHSIQVWGDTLVWISGEGNESEIILYNGTETIQLTENEINEHSIRIWGETVVWISGEGSESEMMLYNGSEVVQLTDDDSVRVFGPHVMGNRVVWQTDDGSDPVDPFTLELFLYDGTETIQLTDNDMLDIIISLSDNNVVWKGHAEKKHSEVFLYNGTETIQLSDSEVDRVGINGYTKYTVRTWGDSVVWTPSGSSTTDRGHVYFYDGTETIRLTETRSAYSLVDIWGNDIVWQGWPDGGNDDGRTEILLYNGTETIQLTDNDIGDYWPEVKEGKVIWTQSHGDHDRKLFLASRCSVEVAVDIKPQLCPNPLNVKSRGVFDVAILGSDTFDVLDIDVSSITLEGVAPIRSRYKDETGPVVAGQECECSPKKKDGFVDLTLKFDTEQITAALGEVEDGQEWQLHLTGQLEDGTPIEGADCVVVKEKGKR